MIDKIEFGDAKQVRKTLLITSFIGVSFKALIENSTGNLEFFGFKIPITDASIIPNFIGYLIIYFIIALFIRYSDESFRKNYKEALEYVENRNDEKKNSKYNEARGIINDNNFKRLFRYFSIIFLDIVFPICLGIFSIYKIFF